MGLTHLNFLVLIIPIHILWQIKINFRQKLVLGATLCLSIVMTMIAIIRISVIRGPKSLDIVWGDFWNQTEACTALIIVSFSAFRSFFVARESREREAQNRQRFWYMNKKDRLRSAWRRRQFRSGSEKMDELPDIPRATLTGMHTFMNRGKTKIGGQPTFLISGGPRTVVDRETMEGITRNLISTGLEEVSFLSICCIFPFKTPFEKMEGERFDDFMT